MDQVPVYHESAKKSCVLGSYQYQESQEFIFIAESANITVKCQISADLSLHNDLGWLA